MWGNPRGRFRSRLAWRGNVLYKQRMLEHDARETIRALADAYCEAELCRASRISRMAIHDGAWISKVLDENSGFNFSVRSYDQVVAWLSENWPANAKWPKGVKRPSAPK